MGIRFWKKPGHDAANREKMARLEKAEAEVADLKVRAYTAIRILDDRNKRNHWRESIVEMIQGV